jgi:hypothetical protein
LLFDSLYCFLCGQVVNDLLDGCGEFVHVLSDLLGVLNALVQSAFFDVNHQFLQTGDDLLAFNYNWLEFGNNINLANDPVPNLRKILILPPCG